MVNKKFNPLSLSSLSPVLKATMIDFNQHIRYSYIVAILRQFTKPLRKNKTTLSVLDVGSGTGLLASYLSSKGDEEFFITNVDIHAKRNISNLVIADGAMLPFRTEAFDFAVSSDVLEHVNEKSRDGFIKELLRCSRFGFVMTYSKIHKKHPYQSGIHIFEKLCGNLPEWYLEHSSNKLVDDNALIQLIQKEGATVKFSKPLTGVMVLFFTGIQLRVHPNKLTNFFLQTTAYLMTRLIDPPPYYSFGLSAIKTH